MVAKDVMIALEKFRSEAEKRITKLEETVAFLELENTRLKERTDSLENQFLWKKDIAA